MVRRMFRSVVLASSAMVLSLSAAAQSIDYGSLEQIFGEPVTNSATGKPQRASEAPVAMEIISQEDIRATGATNLADVLQRVTGLGVARFAAMQADVAVRGLNSPSSPRLLVLVNGRQIYQDHYGLTSWHNLPVTLAEIRQIEVVKGPNTALFGFNAVGGVVNIVTFAPLTDSVSNVTARIGTQGHREIAATHTLKLTDAVGLRLSASGTNADEFDRGGSIAERAEFGDLRQRQAALDLHAQLTPVSQLRIEANLSEARRGQMLPFYSYKFVDEELRSAKATYSLASSLGLIEATVYRNDLELAYNIIDVKNRVTVARLQDLFKIGVDHSFRVAAEYRRNELDLSTTPDATVSYDVYSASAMWDWTVTPTVSLVNAVRLDRLELERQGPMPARAPYGNDAFDRGQTEYSVNSGIVWKASDLDVLRASFARGIQVPSLYEYGEYFDFGVIRAGNPAIDPTIVSNYELAWDRAVPAIGGTLRTALFHQTNDDVKAAYRITRMAPITQTPDNFGDTNVTGAELTLSGGFGAAWDWKASYTFLSVEDEADFPQTAQNFEGSTPRHKIAGEIGYRTGAFDANLFAQYVSRTEMLRSDGALPLSREVPEYLYLAVRLGYAVSEDLTLSVSAFNAASKDSRLTSGFAEERRVYGSISYDF